MKIWVSSLAKVHDVAARSGAATAVSLLSPGDVFPAIEGLADDEHHRVHLNDIRAPQDGAITPNDDHVDGIIRFLRGWDPQTPLLVHCWAGVSRSTATAFVAACLHNPDADEAAIAEAMCDASPTAFPNTLIVSIADRLLERGGRMADAARAVCDDRDRAARVARTGEAQPFAFSARY
ncbi:MAG: protein tyrosine phosphatase [Pseudomonadota bacterium]